jgi:hypothetical protein
MVVWGGQNTSTILGDVWALDLTSGAETWSQLSPTGTAPTPAWQSAYVFDANTSRLYVHGGQTGASYTSQLFYLNISTTNGAWTDTGVTGGLSLRGAVMGYDSTNQRLVCFGGFDGTVVNNTVRYASTSTFSAWNTATTTNTPAARRSAGSTMIGNTFVVSSGRPVSGTWFSDTQELDMSLAPGAWAWTTRSPKVYQPVAIGLTALAEANYHWQSWAGSGTSASTQASFGGNSESAIDFIILGNHAGQLKVYDGSSWVWKSVKAWNGSSWVAKPLRYWSGSTWVPYAAGSLPVSIDAIGPSSTGAVATNTTTLSWSHTCTGTNRYLIASVAVGGGQPGWTTTATCNGNAMTSLGRQQSDNQSDGYVEMFGIIPPAGSCSIVVTSSNTVTQAMIGGSISATSVDQTTPVRTAIKTYGDSTSLLVARTGADGDLFIDAGCSGSPMSTSLQTLQIQQNHDSNTGAGNISMSTTTGATTKDMGYTAQSDWWAIISVALRPA